MDTNVLYYFKYLSKVVLMHLGVNIYYAYLINSRDHYICKLIVGDVNE